MNHENGQFRTDDKTKCMDKYETTNYEIYESDQVDDDDQSKCMSKHAKGLGWGT